MRLVEKEETGFGGTREMAVVKVLASIRTLVQIPSTHRKSWAWQHMPDDYTRGVETRGSLGLVSNMHAQVLGHVHTHVNMHRCADTCTLEHAHTFT